MKDIGFEQVFRRLKHYKTPQKKPFFKAEYNSYTKDDDRHVSVSSKRLILFFGRISSPLRFVCQKSTTMKKLLYSVLLTVLTLPAISQTPAYFISNDCSWNSHDFFAELNSGKVIVLCWVMPCINCVAPSMTTYNVVQSYNTTQADRVRFYLVDDYGDTPCSSLMSWATTNHLTYAKIFSDAAISMTPYETTGMPLIAVVGGIAHKVFYIGKNTVDIPSLQAAIDSALVTTDIEERDANIPNMSVQNNPVHERTLLKCVLSKPSLADIRLLNAEGKQLGQIYRGQLHTGLNEIPMDLSNYPTGMYFIYYNDGLRKKSIKINVVH